MSRHRWYGGYFYGSWKPKQESSDRDTSSTPSSTYPSTTGSTYGGWYSKSEDKDKTPSSGISDSDLDSIYRERYKSALGYGSGYYGSGYYGGYYSGAGYSRGSLWSGTGTEKTYSSYGYVSCDDGEEFSKLANLLMRSVKEARDLVVILDFPFDVKITFSSDDYIKKPNQRMLFVTTSYFDSEDRTDTDKVKLFCSLAVHGAAHLKYSEYRIIRSFINSCQEKYKSQDVSLLTALVNIIEDERVEDLLLKERPGYLEFIENEKLYQYNEFMRYAEKGGTTSTKGLKAKTFLLNLFKLIRFPKNVDLKVIEQYNELYEEIGSIVSPLPASTKDTCVVAEKIYKKIIEFFKSDDFELTSPDDIANLLKSLIQAFDSSFEEMPGGKDSSNPKGASSSRALASGSGTPGEMLSKLCDGGAALGESTNTFFTFVPGDKYSYMTCRDRIAKYIPGIRKLIQGYDKNYDFNITGCRSGLLDTTKLAEAYQGVPHVYTRKGSVVTNKLTVCVLIDESGSMCGRRMDNAKCAAILLNEALKNQPGVDLFIYGHSADIMFTGAVEINVYREGKNTKNEYALGSAEARSENRDGTAILEVAKRVRKQTDNHILMFVISDGYPCARGYGGWPAMKDVRSNVTAAQKLDIDVVQISIDYIEHAKEMFDTYIDISGDVGNMSKNLSNTIKKLIIKNKKSVITQ